jgi:carboxymethylenebutenolidase
MCDDLTEKDNRRWLEQKRVGRREFGALGVGVTAALLVPGCGSSSESEGEPPNPKIITSAVVKIETPDGTADAYIVHPASGRYPAVLIWPDILGLRDAFKTMADRLAKSGYVVLVVNQYYRTATAPVLSSWEEWQTEAGKAKLAPSLAAISPEGVSSDGAAFIEWLDDQVAVDTSKKVGASGYCMGGPFTFRTAASQPERVGAIASLHGGGLVTDMPDSPHLLIPDFKASMLVAIAQNDDERRPNDKTVLADAAEQAMRPAEIEVYPAQHGWCPIDAPAYDQEQADRAWSRMLALFAEYL